MSRKWTEGFCNEKSGFLFSHSCSNTSRDHCGRCQKPICIDHCRYVEQQPRCIECVKKTKDSQQNHDHSYHDDPYFYGNSYYNGYGYYHGYGYAPGFGMMYGHSNRGSHAQNQFNDPNDFTDADSESLGDQNARDFETDMNES